jgi:hypothetical protein
MYVPDEPSIPPEQSAESVLTREESEKKFKSVFMDPAWLVALVIGAWGVVLAMEDFYLADCLAIAAGILLCLKVSAETNLLRRERKPGIFVVIFLAVVALVGADIRWTAHKRVEAAERNEQMGQLSEIPKLQQRLQEMGTAQQKASQDEAIRQAADNQNLRDIQHENEKLRRSIEAKDAALVSIAKDQYALNFFPQIVIMTNDSPDTVHVQNNGKTNVEVERVTLDGREIAGSSGPQTIAPNALTSFKMSDVGRQLILAKAAPGPSTSMQGALYLSTLDKHRYRMSFTLTYVVKDHKIERSYVIDGPMSEEK